MLTADLPPYVAYEDYKAPEYAIFREAEDPHAKDYPQYLPLWWSYSSKVETYEPPRYTGNPLDGRAVRHVEDVRIYRMEIDPDNPRLGYRWGYYNGAICLARVLCPPGQVLTINRIETYARGAWKGEQQADIWFPGLTIGHDIRTGLDDLDGFVTWGSKAIGTDPEENPNVGAGLGFITGLRRYGNPFESANLGTSFIPSPYGVLMPGMNYLPISFYGVPGMWSDCRYRFGLGYNNTKILVPESNWFELWFMSWGWYPYDPIEEEYYDLLHEVGGRLIGHVQDYHGNPEAFHYARQALG